MIMNRNVKLKICLIGDGGVGKTSLIKRYVFDQFSDGYITTIGTKVTKKELKIEHPTTKEELNVTMLIWDIMGQPGFRELLQEAYFYGAQGGLAVCDITRKDTLSGLDGWIDSLHDVTKNIPVVFIGNKSDLMDDAEFKFEELKEFASKYGGPTVLLSSAKTGVNVNLAFKNLAENILKKNAEGKGAPAENTE
jgi:small GTP-binding protein